jgi:hypothetical protein
MLNQIIDQEEQSGCARDFILRLCSATNLSEGDKIEAIKVQLKGLEQNRYYAFVVDSLDPQAFHPVTKLLSDSERQILSRALDEYTK